MKFCKNKEIESTCFDEKLHDQNREPNLPEPILQKPSAISQQRQEQAYRSQIELFLFSQKPLKQNIEVQICNQNEISERMRGVLLNWLMQVHQKYKMMAETFLLTVRIIDEYLSKQSVSRQQLQLMGTAALWIAAKYQQTYQVPKINNLVFICDNMYSAKDILLMQGMVLSVIGFDKLIGPTSLHYYDLIHNYAKLSQKDYFLGKFLLLASVFDVQLSKFPPASFAYSLIFFIKKLRGYLIYNDSAIADSRINEIDLKLIVRYICLMWQKIDSLECLTNLRRIFSQKKYYQVSKISLTRKSI